MGHGQARATLARDHRHSFSAAAVERATGALSTSDIFELFPYGILVLDDQGAVKRMNRAASELLAGGMGSTCCEIFGCGRAGGPLERSCLTRLALERSGALPEVRIDFSGPDGSTAGWVTAARLRSDARTVLVHIRPGATGDRRQRTTPHWIADRRLQVTTLGRTGVRNGEECDLGGNWISQRPGKLFKYLLSERHRVVYVDEIAEALWPGGDQSAAGNVRHFIHALRARLEPDREKRAPASFVVSDAGGYRLDLANVDVDADRFERDVRAGRMAFEHGDVAAARELLDAAIGLYRGEFISDEPYALWAIRERDRLRALAESALDTLAQIACRDDDYDAAIAHLERIADMHPFDTEASRRLIAMAVYCGRRTLAQRRYTTLKMRLLKEFGEPPDFDLADVAREVQRELETPPPLRA